MDTLVKCFSGKLKQEAEESKQRVSQSYGSQEKALFTFNLVQLMSFVPLCS